MIYPQNFEQKIGFDQIRSLIKEKCLSSLGTDYTDRMQFSTDYDAIRKQLNCTWEFVHIIELADDFPADFFFDVRASLKRVRIEGTFLEESELFDLRRSLDTIQAIVRFLRPGEEEEIRYPYLHELAQEVEAFPQLVKQIDAILDKFGHIKDNASPALAQIRSSIASTLSSISRNLNSILRAAQSEGFVDKEVSPTMRDGRLVIPVAPSYKRKIKGIVHDESASGKTIFIEPAEVVEANNRVRELENEERREIVRILTAFTDTLRPYIDEIIYSYEFLAEIDFIRAKALLALETGGTLPRFENKRQIEWYHAVHPLLYLSLKRQGKTVVPLDLTLDNDGQDFGNGKVTVTATIPMDAEPEEISVIYNGTTGTQPTIDSWYWSDGELTVTFTTSHFSEFIIIGGNEVTVTTEDALVSSLKSGLYVTLGTDISRTTSFVEITDSRDRYMSDALVIEHGGSLDLAGHVLKYFDLHISGEGCEFTLNDSVGNGKMIADGFTYPSADDSPTGYLVSVWNGATAIINGGSFISNIFCCVYASEGKVIVNGGTFEVESSSINSSYAPDYTRYTLNLYDSAGQSGTAIIEVRGGTFYNYDPSASMSENPLRDFVPDGCVVTSSSSGDDTLYTVTEAA